MPSLDKTVDQSIKELDREVVARIKKARKKDTTRLNKDRITKLTISTDPHQFYRKLGLLYHPDTNKLVEKLADYQYKIWREVFEFPYRLTLKSQKIGLSTSILMEDLQLALLPTTYKESCRGKDILIVGQTYDQALEHLHTLRRMLVNSDYFGKFLITKPDKALLRDEATKVSVIFLRNPEDEKRPTRIIARGPDERGLWSWKTVKHIHMSDIAINDSVDDSGTFNASFSRLANTNGTMHIETPPKGQLKTTWKIYQASKLKEGTKNKILQFRINEISYHEAIEADIITEEFIEGERERLGPEFPVYYECQFQNPSTTWYDKDLFRFSDKLAEKVNYWNSVAYVPP